MSTLSKRLANLTDRQMYLLDMITYSTPETIVCDCRGSPASICSELEEIKNILGAKSILAAHDSYERWLDGYAVVLQDEQEGHI